MLFSFRQILRLSWHANLSAGDVTSASYRIKNATIVPRFKHPKTANQQPHTAIRRGVYRNPNSEVTKAGIAKNEVSKKTSPCSRRNIEAIDTNAM
jgi:hypothetical protein